MIDYPCSLPILLFRIFCPVAMGDFNFFPMQPHLENPFMSSA